MIFALRCHSFLFQLGDRLGRLLQALRAHALEHMGILGELNVIVRHHFDSVPPRIAKVQPLVDALEAEFFHRPAHRLAIVHDKTEMALVVGPLCLAEAQLDELIAKIDESIVIGAVPQLEVKQRAVKFERLIEIAPTSSTT